MTLARLTAVLVLAASPALAQQTDWSTFNGNLAAQKFSTITQITPENVASLERVWDLHTTDFALEGAEIPSTAWSATPIYANGTLYLATPFYRIFAIDPATGAVKWIHDSKARLEAPTQPHLKSRGVAYWQAENPVPGEACQKRVYVGTMFAQLHAVDADTGQPCADFGTNGILDVNQWNTTNDKWPLSLLQPPTVFEDQLFLGWAGKDWAYAEAPPGTVFALDARTGKLNWQFDALPPDLRKKSGTGNVWASMSVDEDNRILYIPVSAPSPNYWGGNRVEDTPLSPSTTALNVDTGEVIWSFQHVHHDLWDYDANSAPTLVDIRKDGQTIPALVQTTKNGMFFVLNRLTGEPVYPVTEIPVPQTDVPSEQTAPTQPYVARPAPATQDEFPGIFPLVDIASFGRCSARMKSYRYEGRFTPPSTQGTVIWPSTIGGVEWGGGTVDPRTGMFYVNTSDAPQVITLVPREDYDRARENGGSAGGLTLDDSYHAQDGAPYAVKVEVFWNALEMPCWKPPYGHMLAYDLTTGEQVYKVPFGQIQRWGFYMPESWGSITIGAPVLTQTGVIFIGASMDKRVRALDARDGSVLWKDLVDAAAVASPAVFTHEGRDYAVFVAGGNPNMQAGISDQVVAYALPR